jgi:signal transduction histidine kinase
VLAVVREGLTNVAKHAEARETTVSLAVGAEAATLEVSDDGVGMGSSRRRSGVANIRRRAERWNGTASFRPRDGGGTLLTWTARLDRPRADDENAMGRSRHDASVPGR